MSMRMRWKRKLPTKCQFWVSFEQIRAGRAPGERVVYVQLMTTVNPIPGDVVRLNELPPGVCGIVREIETDDEETKRLKTLGVCAGRRVELVRGGDPLVLKIFGTRLGLSGALATRVRVEICAPEHCELRHENFCQ